MVNRGNIEIDDDVLEEWNAYVIGKKPEWPPDDIIEHEKTIREFIDSIKRKPKKV